MTEIRVYRDGRSETVDDEASALAAATESGTVAWFDLLATDAAGIAATGRALGWKAVVAEQLHRTHKRARLEITDHSTIAVFLPACYLDDTETVLESSLAVVLTPHAVVTIRGDAWVDLAPARAIIEQHPQLARTGRGVLWAIAASVLDGYGPVLTGVEDDIDEIEVAMFEQESDVSRRIFALQRELIALQHASAPLPEMLDALADVSTGGDDAFLAPKFRDTSDAAEHVTRRVAGFRATLDNALTVHATLVGEQSNVEMKRMTEFSIRQNDQVKKISSWAAIGFAPSLVAGIYGMNFHVMPELSWPWGYPLALALMVGVAGGLYTVFKCHDWL